MGTRIYFNPNFIRICKTFPKFAFRLIKYAGNLDEMKLSLLYELFCEQSYISINFTREQMEEKGVVFSEITPTNINSSTEIIGLSKNMTKYEIRYKEISNEIDKKILTITPLEYYVNEKDSKKQLFFIFEAIYNYNILGNCVSKNIQAISKEYACLTDSLTEQKLKSYRQKIIKLNNKTDKLYHR